MADDQHLRDTARALHDTIYLLTEALEGDTE